MKKLGLTLALTVTLAFGSTPSFAGVIMSDRTSLTPQCSKSDVPINNLASIFFFGGFAGILVNDFASIIFDSGNAGRCTTA